MFAVKPETVVVSYILMEKQYSIKKHCESESLLWFLEIKLDEMSTAWTRLGIKITRKKERKQTGFLSIQVAIGGYSRLI